MNKKHGHTYGNLVISSFGNTFSTYSDIVIRYGGDEFVILSNKLLDLTTCYYYSIGFSRYNTNLLNTIMLADKDMLNNKQRYKKEQEFYGL